LCCFQIPEVLLNQKGSANLLRRGEDATVGLKNDFGETGCADVGRILLVEDRIIHRELLNTVMNLHALQTQGTSWQTFQRMSFVVESIC
jgi:hypothetical protein